MIDGLEIVTSAWLTQPGEPVEVRRTWRQRFFTRPWRPWRATYTMIPQVPMDGAVQIGPRKFVMHPDTLLRLKSLMPPSDGIMNFREHGSR
jgi:hypothetical protein